MNLLPMIPMTMPISVSTTRISIRVIPRTLADVHTRQRDSGRAAARPCMITSPRPKRAGWLDAASSDKFAHPHDAEQNREHDATDHHREAQDEHGLEHAEKALERML